VRPESVKGSVLHVQSENSDTLSLGGHEEIKSEVLDEEVGVVLERLSVESVQHGVSSSVGGGGTSVSWEGERTGERRKVSDDVELELKLDQSVENVPCPPFPKFKLCPPKARW